ncbi:MAG: RHS repeat-associated core domain-containing protein [Microscillaceae bacterium]|nr:RHS repeat-associated core domain-containing protein [Microscillaceae bacterium]
MAREKRYHPFGLNIVGIEKKGSPDHKFQFNGVEKEEEFGLMWNETTYRSYDLQLGRWHQIDPKASERESPYTGFANNPVSYSDFLGDIVKKERGEDVSKEDHRRMKQAIRYLRKNSESFNKMYKDMNNSDQLFVYKSINKPGGDHFTDKPWETEDGSTVMNINVIEEGDLLKPTAHESGHGWRILQGLDTETNLIENPEFPGLQDASKYENYLKQMDRVDAENQKRSVDDRKKAEVGAMHIENIVISEVNRKTGSNIPMDEKYPFGIELFPSLTPRGIPSYKPIIVPYDNKYSLDYYKRVIDIHKEHDRKPIQKKR